MPRSPTYYIYNILAGILGGYYLLRDTKAVGHHSHEDITSQWQIKEFVASSALAQLDQLQLAVQISPWGAPCAESTPCHRIIESWNNTSWKRPIRIIKFNSWYVSYTETCPKCEKNVVEPGDCRGDCLTAQMFFKPCFLFLQQACAILVLKPLKQEITLEMPKQDDI